MNLKEFTRCTAEAETFLKAMANHHRLTILCELHKAEWHESALQDAVSLSLSALSQHRARKRDNGLVNTRSKSQTIYDSLANPKVSRRIALPYELYRQADCAPADLISIKELSP